MNLQELERIVKIILLEPVFVEKVQKYKSLQDRLYAIDVSNNDDYRDDYREFYRTNLRLRANVNFECEYLKILQFVKNEKHVQQQDVMDSVSAITGCCEIVFVSKILHNIDTNVPIYDSVVGAEHFNYKRRAGASFEQRKTRNLQMYNEYCTSFIGYMKSPDGQKIIELFDRYLPDYKNISDVKKVDFVLWRDENNEIQISAEYRYSR